MIAVILPIPRSLVFRLPSLPREFGAADCGQLRKPAFYGFPNDLALTREIFVGEDIAHAEDLAPWNLGIARRQLLGEIPGRLANREEPVCRRVLNIQVFEKLLARQASGLLLDAADQFQNIQ